MRLKHEKKEYHFETLLPLVNIVFLLLIFFLLAGAFQPPEPFEVSSCLLYTSPSPRDAHESRMPSSA